MILKDKLIKIKTGGYFLLNVQKKWILRQILGQEIKSLLVLLVLIWT